MRQCNDHLYNDQKNIVVVTNFLVIAKQIVQLQRTLSVYSTVFISIYSEYTIIFFFFVGNNPFLFCHIVQRAKLIVRNLKKKKDKTLSSIIF